ncbi:MAG TPA: universal stress protein [Thermomicrobiales bacterium]|nr:universal stress protein [Thermomicrobiales bacterium]
MHDPPANGGPISKWIELRRLLVPLDGSRRAEAAIPPALALAERTGATVTLIHVLEHDAPATVHGEPHLNTTADAAAYLEREAARFVTAGVSVETHVHDNPERDVSASIAAHGNELNVDLIVLAAHGAGGLRGFLFGRVAQQVLRRGTRPLFLVQADGEDDTARRYTCDSIALLLDGSTQAIQALPIALPVAHAFQATMHLIAAVPTVGQLGSNRSPAVTLLPGAARAVLDLEEDATADYLSRVATAVRNQGIVVTTTVVRGDPADATVAAAERVHADLLALATHGRQGLSGIWSGSIGARVLARFNRPLLLARAPE